VLNANPGFAKGYYRGSVFLYRVKCRNLVRVGGAQVETDCGWIGYRVYPRWGPCPHCGFSVEVE
jgi:hypothetical protein